MVVADLNSQGGETAVAECAAAGGRAVFQRTDVTSEADIKAAVARAVKEYGRLDIMFNNAGVAGAVGRSRRCHRRIGTARSAVLLRAVFLGMKHSIPEMRKAGGGSIITTASIAGLRGVGYLAAYSAAKAAVVNLTAGGRDRSRARQDSRQLHLPRRRQHAADPSRQFRAAKSDRKSRWRECSRYQRAGKPEDIATMALFLASDESEWITGTAMVVDGGINTGNARFRLAGLPDSGFSGPSFEM